MHDWIINNFQWILSFHIVAVVCWFAALFYLPRLFVYHAMASDEVSIERFKVMERKLFRAIGNPSMVATILLGGLMIGSSPSYYMNSTWFLTKLVLVAILIVYHHACLYLMKQLERDNCQLSHVFFRWFNEAPVLLLIGIVIMVVVRPF